MWAKMPKIISGYQQELQSNGVHLSYQFFFLGYTLHLVEYQRVNASCVLLIQLKKEHRDCSSSKTSILLPY